MPGDRFLSLLPPWHMYERAAEYFSLAQGIEQVYTNVKSLKVFMMIHFFSMFPNTAKYSVQHFHFNVHT
jgi:long-subunit acyl-CoA synthetase (AMP-forming)